MSSKPLRSTFVVGGATMVSRIFGYARDAVIFILFGANGGTDAFFVAFRIPNFLRRLFAEGAFSQAFVPVLAEYRDKGPDEFHRLINHTTGILSLILFAVTVLGTLAAPILIAIFAPGFSGDETRSVMATEMLRITFPYIFFISLVALSGSVLNTLERFAVPALTPVLLNASLIGAAIWLAPLMDQPVYALAWGVFIAGISQLLFQIPFLLRARGLPIPKLVGAKEGVRKIMRLMLPAIFGSSVVQINLLVDTLIASFLAVGSISWLYVSDRFVELPLALFGIATATVILPMLSRQHTRTQPEAFSDTLNWALRLSLLVALPAMAGLILLAYPILATLVQYQQFTPLDSQMASLSLAAYALGLPAFVFIKILAPGFYARQDTKTPVKIGIIAMLANMLLNLIFVYTWLTLDWPGAHTGLALATSVSAYINAYLLFRKLKQNRVLQSSTDKKGFVAPILFATVIMTAILAWMVPISATWDSWNALERVLQLFFYILISVGVYTVVLAAFGIRPRHLKLNQQAQLSD